VPSGNKVTLTSVIIAHNLLILYIMARKIRTLKDMMGAMVRDDLELEYQHKPKYHVGQRVRIVGIGHRIVRTGNGEAFETVYNEDRVTVWQPYAIVKRVTTQQVTVVATDENFTPFADAVEQLFSFPTGHRIRHNNERSTDKHIDLNTWIEII